MALHKSLGLGDIHIPYQWAYADAAARVAASGFVAGDLGRFARQLDDNSLWLLIATTPTWTLIIPTATTATDGLLSAADKTKIDTFAQGNVTLPVRNETGSTIPVAMLVVVTGWSVGESRLLVGIADKDDPAKRPAIGLTAAAVPNNTNADVLVAGELTGIDTTAWGLTDQLVLGNAGGMVRPPPETDPFTGEVQNVGSTTRIHATEGRIAVVLEGMNPISGPKMFALVGTSGTPSDSNKYVTDADSRMTDARTPASHASTHDSGGADAMAIDEVAGTGSLRTLGTAATSACAGNDSRLSDARTPTSHASSHQSGGADAIKLDDLATPDDNTDLDASTSEHGLLPKLGGGTANFLRADGTWNPPVAVFGEDYQTAVSLARSTTTSTDFQTKTTLTTPALTGTYRIGWHSIVDQNSIADKVEARLQNVTDGITVGVTNRHEPQDATNRIAVGGFAEVVFSGVAKTFQIQYRQQDGNTAGIQDARIEIWRVA